MGYLIIVALIQAFSFSLIGEYLAGHVDSYFAVLARVLLAGLVFLPLTRWRQVEPRFKSGEVAGTRCHVGFELTAG